jgi:hypothetical protein
VKYVLPLRTRTEKRWPDDQEGGRLFLDLKYFPVVIEDLIFEQAGQILGQYRRIGTLIPHFSSEVVQKLVKVIKTSIRDSKETEYEKR